MPRTEPMRLLCVLSPSNQLYSGIGRALFELTTRLADRVRFEFAMTDFYTKNLDILRRYCDQHGFPLHVGVGRGRSEPWSLDTFHDGLPDLIRRIKPDAVECLCWANAATNEGVLEGVGDAVLGYTPHDQPIWTVPMSPEQAAHIERVHQRMLERADVVWCDSPKERDHLQKRVPGRNNCRFVALGCDFDGFRPGPLQRREQLLFVGDLAEPRKRFDRVVALLERLLPRFPTYRLVVVGNRSDAVRDRIPPHLRHACELKGYVDEPTLRDLYARSAGLVLLSDFEAFGIPILEALACGTPVFLSEQETTRSLFGPFVGARFCPADDPDATAALVADTLGQGAPLIAACLADRPRLRATFDWDALAEQKWRSLAAAWFDRRRWSLSA